MTESILWRAIDWPGHEACSLYRVKSEWRLEGTAVKVRRAGSLT